MKSPIRRLRVGLYPGTFDPITNGHMDIIRRAARLVDHLVIGVATNETKGPLFTVSERVEMVKHEVAPIAVQNGIKITVEPFGILLMHFAEKIGATMIVRGLRAVSDFEYEFQMVGMNMEINPDIETVFLMADPKHQSIASRLVKEICALNGDVTAFASPFVIDKLMAKYADRRAATSKLDGAKARPVAAARAVQAVAVPQRRSPVRPRRR
ncbi:MAG TPA: pantetheine-phosphate adenylyltransferase [Alphaproteobacteria bacterium]|nr:pantetheine-phosphate adenylyltransferase [Alphaproteobacteria bacterium]